MQCVIVEHLQLVSLFLNVSSILTLDSWSSISHTMAPAVPLMVTPDTPRGHPSRHLSNGWPRPIQSPRVASHDPRHFIRTVPPIEPAVLPSAGTGAFPHWIFTPEPGASGGDDLHGGTHSDHVPVNAIVAIILTMVVVGGLLALVVGGQMLRWSKQARLAKGEVGRRRASTGVPQVGGVPAVGKHTQS